MQISKAYTMDVQDREAHPRRDPINSICTLIATPEDTFDSLKPERRLVDQNSASWNLIQSWNEGEGPRQPFGAQFRA